MTETQCLGGSTIHSLVTFLKTKVTSDYQVEKGGWYEYEALNLMCD